MFRNLVFSILLAAFLGQGWAQASMAGMAAPAMQEDCAGQMAFDTSCDCCPDGAMAAGACASACSAAFALASVAPDVAVGRGQFDSSFFPPVRAGPRYLPLNPPPIA
jgi:hypothetical protein